MLKRKLEDDINTAPLDWATERFLLLPSDQGKIIIQALLMEINGPHDYNRGLVDKYKKISVPAEAGGYNWTPESRCLFNRIRDEFPEQFTKRTCRSPDGYRNTIVDFAQARRYTDLKWVINECGPRPVNWFRYELECIFDSMDDNGVALAMSDFGIYPAAAVDIPGDMPHIASGVVKYGRILTIEFSSLTKLPEVLCCLITTYLVFSP